MDFLAAPEFPVTFRPMEAGAAVKADAVGNVGVATMAVIGAVAGAEASWPYTASLHYRT